MLGAVLSMLHVLSHLLQQPCEVGSIIIIFIILILKREIEAQRLSSCPRSYVEMVGQDVNLGSLIKHRRLK